MLLCPPNKGNVEIRASKMIEIPLNEYIINESIIFQKYKWVWKIISLTLLPKSLVSSSVGTFVRHPKFKMILSSETCENLL